MEKSLQRSRPRHEDVPACHARIAQETNCASDPSRRMRKCAETSWFAADVRAITGHTRLLEDNPVLRRSIDLIPYMLFIAARDALAAPAEWSAEPAWLPPVPGTAQGVAEPVTD